MLSGRWPVSLCRFHGYCSDAGLLFMQLSITVPVNYVVLFTNQDPKSPKSIPSTHISSHTSAVIFFSIRTVLWIQLAEIKITRKELRECEHLSVTSHSNDGEIQKFSFNSQYVMPELLYCQIVKRTKITSTSKFFLIYWVTESHIWNICKLKYSQ